MSWKVKRNNLGSYRISSHFRKKTSLNTTKKDYFSTHLQDTNYLCFIYTQSIVLPFVVVVLREHTQRLAFLYPPLWEISNSSEDVLTSSSKITDEAKAGSISVGLYL